MLNQNESPERTEPEESGLRSGEPPENSPAPRRGILRPRVLLIALIVAGFIGCDILFVSWYLEAPDLDAEYSFLYEDRVPQPTDIGHDEPVLTLVSGEVFYNAVVAALTPLHPRSPGIAASEETFAAFSAKKRNRPSAKRKNFYIRPLGSFSSSESRIVASSTVFMEKCFGCPSVLLPVKPLDAIDAKYRRSGPYGEQFFTGHLLAKVLFPEVPADAVGLMGVTSADLWAGRGWNYVFGEGAFTLRIGVSSLRRMVEGSPMPSESLALMRTVKLLAHEAGHMFSLYHCMNTPCMMEFGNSLSAHDASVVHFCPECTAKLCWSLRLSPTERFSALAEWFEANGYNEEAEYCTKAKAALVEAKIPTFGNGKSNNE